MKIKLYFFSILFISIAFNSCKKADFLYQNDFKKSYNEWAKFKETSGNSYQYMVAGGSWSGMGWETVITVNNGKIIKRDFKISVPSGWPVNIPDNEKEWTENENEISSHENTAAAGAITLDEVYEEARNNWLKKRSDAKTYFESKNNGLISLSGYITDGCQDDCFNGISINFIKSL